MDTSNASPPSIAVSGSEVGFLKDLLSGEVQRYRALVELGNIVDSAQNGVDGFSSKLLIEQLTEYPTKELALSNLVGYPPKLEPIPVKPLFFDAAWNYIEYPDRKLEVTPKNVAQAVAPDASSTKQEPQPQQKRGWFGFRS